MNLPKQTESPILMILAGPTGTGKTTLCDRMEEEYDSISRVVTSTTRAPREGEEQGIHYHFFSEDEFDQKISEDAFYEHAQVHKYRYGTLKSEINSKLEAGHDLVLNVDVQGVQAFREAALNDPILKKRLVTVFLMPPSFEEIKNRLESRGKETAEQIAMRLETAEKEMPLWVGYDFCLLSKTKDEDYARIESILKSEKMRVARLV